ncbi:hypothetical protein [Marilutibacter alkalisoli]|uniref:Uncharacterized protein n=1 Tax=Marilutibacter alkalisoli TaxID=2591633 RepID=A0A514BUW2_9GAMM|nr:hypothetical protein [Lysobacter alkalisoli]QDH71156.1 hypothetical protein FKV23_14470 [Lysobacter alkalisoli]
MGKTGVTFLDGHSPRRNSLGLIAFPNNLDGRTNFCRFFSKTPDDRWFHTDFDFQAKAVSAIIQEHKGYKAWWVLGKNGEVAELVIGGPTNLEQIAGAGLNRPQPYGYLESLKNIRNTLYACGYGRQVYRRDSNGWISIADSILTREEATGFFDIDGLDHDNLYAVGWKGEIYFYDGSRWLKDDSPTTAHLSSVKCLDDGTVFISGDRGIVLKGSFNHWQLIETEGFTGNWYGLESFNGAIYLAGNAEIARVEGSSIVPVNVAEQPITTHRLDAREGLLWSIGESDIYIFDGDRWMEVKHPDNR